MTQILSITLETKAMYPETIAEFRCDVDEIKDPAEFVHTIGNLAFKELNRRLREPVEQPAQTT